MVKIREAFMILIGIVFVTTIFFGVLVYRQTGKLQKTALAAKQQRELFSQETETQTDSEGHKED